MNRDSSPVLAGLKRDIAGIELACRDHRQPAPVPTGHAAIDHALGGGIAPARLHDVFAGEADDAASASAFAAMLAVQHGMPTLWVRETRSGRGHLYADGLADIGLDPAGLLLCTVPDGKTALKTANDAARCSAAGIVIVELWRAQPALTLTAGRRLATAAGVSGATVIMLRIDAEPVPSVATTRWSVAAAPSLALPASAPGHPAFDLTLLRQRGRAETGLWRVAWNADDGLFHPFGEPAALPRVPRALPAVRPAGSDIERRAA